MSSKPHGVFPHSVGPFRFGVELEDAKALCVGLYQSTDPELENVWFCPNVEIGNAIPPIKLSFGNGVLDNVAMRLPDMRAAEAAFARSFGEGERDKWGGISWRPVGGWIHLLRDGREGYVFYYSHTGTPK